MPPAPRPELAQSAEIVHGTPDRDELARLGLDASAVLDFSANTNPFGPSPRVMAALAEVSCAAYPDREATALRSAMAELWRVSPAQILAGNGASELIGLVALAYLRPGDSVLILGPTFGEYRRVTCLMGAVPHEERSRPEDAFQPNERAIERRLDELRPRIAFLCRPNNPTGRLVPLSLLQRWAVAAPETLFVVDEAYLEFVADAESAIRLANENVLVLRSMTKAYALAGLRLGYVVGSPPTIAALRSVRPPWNVNAVAQAAGMAALADQAHLLESLSRLEHAKRELLTGLRARGLAPLDSMASFFLLPIDDGARVRERLLRGGILVRDCASFGLPQYIRMSVQRPEHNARLLAALVEVCGC